MWLILGKELQWEFNGYTDTLFESANLNQSKETQFRYNPLRPAFLHRKVNTSTEEEIPVEKL
jgi:hypothetical protein